jgi:hypothetical protein
MSQLVDEDSVEHPGRNRAKPVGYPDLTGIGVARTPAFALVAHPADRTRPDTVEVAVCQLFGAFLESMVVRMVHRGSPQEALYELVDNGVAFCGAEPRGNENDDPAVFP